MEASRNCSEVPTRGKRRFDTPPEIPRVIDPEAPRTTITNREHGLARLLMDGQVEIEFVYQHVLPPETYPL